MIAADALRDATALVLAAAALPVLAAAAYIALLALLSWRPSPRTGAAPVPIRFDVIVPAHDEEAGIARTLASLATLDYPRAARRIIVVADNCRDRTADVARAGGALVLERHDDTRRGKGYALAYAFSRSVQAGVADAVVVVDADTTVSSNLLAEFAAGIAHGHQALQADYGVRNAGESWRTRLMALALALTHRVRSVARERLGLSCGLRGNGMCFTLGVLRRVPYAAFSLVEDVEYGAELALAGTRVAYVHAARVDGDMPAHAAGAATQRRRWEAGRKQVARRYVPLLLRRGVVRRDLRLLELAVDLLMPPLAELTTVASAGLLVAIVAAAAGVAPAVIVVPWAAAAACIAVYVARGCVATGLGVRVLRDLAWAPAYVAWKLVATRRRTGAPTEWVRTVRTATR